MKERDRKPPRCPEVYSSLGHPHLPYHIFSLCPSRTALIPKHTNHSWLSGLQASQRESGVSEPAKKGYTPNVKTVFDPCLVCLPKSCPEAINDVFNSKFHIIGAVGIGIAVVMVSSRWSREEAVPKLCPGIVGSAIGSTANKALGVLTSQVLAVSISFLLLGSRSSGRVTQREDTWLG